MLPNISRSQDNEAMKIGQLIEYNIIIFCQNHIEFDARRLVPDLFLFFTKMIR